MEEDIGQILGNNKNMQCLPTGSLDKVSTNCICKSKELSKEAISNHNWGPESQHDSEDILDSDLSQDLVEDTHTVVKPEEVSQNPTEEGKDGDKMLLFANYVQFGIFSL